MQKSFSFKGITRHSDDLLVSDGECMELVNLRVKDGCLEPLPSEYNETELEYCYEKAYRHPVSEMLLCVEYRNQGRVHFYDKDLKLVKSEAGEDELFPDLCNIVRIEFVGSLVCCFSDSTTYYLVYDSGEYRWLGVRPFLPELSFSYDSIVVESATDDEYLAGVSLRKEDAPTRWGNVSKGYFDHCLSMLHSRGYYVDRALFRYALRLFDGSYFCYSPIYYVDDDNAVGELARDAKNFYSKPLESSASSSRYVARVQGFLPTFHLKNLDLSAWSNIVVGVDIFTTGSIYGHKVVTSNEEFSIRNNVRYSKDDGFERYVEKGGEEIMNDVQNAAMFYKIAEFNAQGVLVDSVKDVSLSSLALCDSLPDEAGSQTDRSASYTLFFNGRLHLAGVKESFMKGYGPRAHLPAGVTPTKADYALVVTRIKTTAGVAVVKREYIRDYTLGLKDGALWMTPYIMYPDSRAFEIMFTITMGDVTYRRTFPLKQHRMLNLASYVNAGGSRLTVSLECHLTVGTRPSSYSVEGILAYFSNTPGVYEIKYVSGGIWYYGDKPFVLDNATGSNTLRRLISTLNPHIGDTIKITISKNDEVSDVKGVEDIAFDDSWEIIEEVVDVAEENCCEVRGNVLKVSAVDNPFCFAPINTYTPSQGDILAISSNAVALSQGQFGQYPLYVFSKDGVWAMEGTASGGVTYARSYPVARELCTNGNSICCTDSGVLFLAKRGIMLLQGSSLSCITDAIDAESHFMQGVDHENILYKIARITETQYALSREPLSDFLKGNVAMGYVSAENEVWVSNNDFNYSYVYSLSNGTWTKISKSFMCFVNSYPHQLYLRIVDDKSYIAVIDRENALRHTYVTLFTRPQLLGSKLPKRILQFMLHAAVRITDTGHYIDFCGLACYLLCSNDGVHFKLVAGAEKKNDFNDMVFPYFPTQAYKYYIVALTGSVALESRIVGAEILIEPAWENRLR